MKTPRPPHPNIPLPRSSKKYQTIKHYISPVSPPTNLAINDSIPVTVSKKSIQDPTLVYKPSHRYIDLRQGRKTITTVMNPIRISVTSPHAYRVNSPYRRPEIAEIHSRRSKDSGASRGYSFISPDNQRGFISPENHKYNSVSYTN